MLKYKIVNTPVGPLKIVVEEKALIAILWDNEKPNRVKLGPMIKDEQDSLILEVATQLNEYFFQGRKKFNLPFKNQGTPFQTKVWEELKLIPFGSSLTYKAIATKINHPHAVRAVGTAIGRNPLSIIVPCHRVLASNGGLGGFAGGIDRKKVLLDIEKHAKDD